MQVTIKTYSFEETRKSFLDWSLEEIMEEYVKVNKRHQELMSEINFEKFIKEIEEVDNSRDFLAHYLAMYFCIEKGAKGV